MSGHSKWATIRRKKAVVDQKRGKVFTKLIREISVAARQGGGDPGMNPRLRLAIQAAKAANMPQDNISRAIAKGTGELEGTHYEEIAYEGYGAGGTAIMVDVVTDNRNRTVAEIRHLFTKHSGSLGETGCVAWMFDRRGRVRLAGESLDEDRVMEIALEAGADDVRALGRGEWEVLTAPADLENVRAAFEEKGIEPLEVELARVPKDQVPVAGKEASQVLRLVESLEEHDDVQAVHANFDISEEEMERLAAGA